MKINKRGRELTFYHRAAVVAATATAAAVNILTLSFKVYTVVRGQSLNLFLSRIEFRLERK